MPSTATEVLRLALLSYEAATEPKLWPVFLKGCVESVSGDSAVLQIHDFRQRKSTILTGFGLNPRLKDSYNEYYSKINIWRDHGFISRKYAAGRTNLDQELCPRPLVERSEFYNDGLLPMNITSSMGSVIARHNDHAPTLTLLRGRGGALFGEAERNVANFLLPYLMRAWSVYQRLDVLIAGERILDGLPYGVIFLSANGSVVYSNRWAERFLREGDGLSMWGGMLRAADPTANASLRNMLARALSAGSPAAAVPVFRLSGRRAYQVVAAPLRDRFPQFTGMAAPAAVVFIVDPESAQLANVDLLIQLYGLTSKEALMARKLAEGKTVEQAAEELQIRYETARTHLRRIFSKTQTSRQSELLLLLARLPGEGS